LCLCLRYFLGSNAYNLKPLFVSSPNRGTLPKFSIQAPVIMLQSQQILDGTRDFDHHPGQVVALGLAAGEGFYRLEDGFQDLFGRLLRMETND